MGTAPPILYPLIMLAAVATALVLGRGSSRNLGLTRRERILIRLGAFCGAMIGAKLPFALSDWHALLTGRVWLENGKTIVFGLVGGYAGVEIVKSYLGVRVKTGDSFAVPVAAAVGVGRLSCFVAGCCHGTPTQLPWAIDFGDGIHRHPTQLYEMAFHLNMACILAGLRALPVVHQPALQILPSLLPDLPLCLRVDPPRTDPRPRPHRLPVGLPGFLAAGDAFVVVGYD